MFLSIIVWPFSFESYLKASLNWVYDTLLFTFHKINCSYYIIFVNCVVLIIHRYSGNAIFPCQWNVFKSDTRTSLLCCSFLTKTLHKYRTATCFATYLPLMLRYQPLCSYNNIIRVVLIGSLRIESSLCLYLVQACIVACYSSCGFEEIKW